MSSNKGDKVAVYISNGVILFANTVSTVLLRTNTRKVSKQQLWAGIGMSVLAMGVSTLHTEGIKKHMRKECEEVESRLKDVIFRSMNNE